MIENRLVVLFTVVTVLPSANYALVDPEIIVLQKTKKNTNMTPFYPYQVGLLVIVLMAVVAGVAAYAIYR